VRDYHRLLVAYPPDCRCFESHHDYSPLTDYFTIRYGPIIDAYRLTITTVHRLILMPSERAPMFCRSPRRHVYHDVTPKMTMIDGKSCAQALWRRLR